MTWDHKYIKDYCSYYMGYEAGLKAAKKEYMEILGKTMINSFDDAVDRDIKMYNTMAKTLIDKQEI